MLKIQVAIQLCNSNKEKLFVEAVLECIQKGCLVVHFECLSTSAQCTMHIFFFRLVVILYCCTYFFGCLKYVGETEEH